ncbi:MAG: hypothetical protein ACFFB5_04785 [Promethearchaeota archaeon]
MLNEVVNEDKTSNDEEKAQRPSCKYCGNEIPYISKYCPICGEQLF